MYKNKTISLILPCLNEEEGLRAMLPNVPSFVDEIIVADNNSQDHSAEVAGSFARVKVVCEKQRGYGRAYKKGFKAATGDVIITMDSDNTYPLVGAGDLLDIFFNQNLDFMSACRFPLKNQTAMPLINRLGNFILTIIFNLLTGKAVKDSQSGMWIFYRSLLSQMHLVSDGMSFSEEIKMEASFNKMVKFYEVRIDYNDRKGMVKLNKWRDGAQNILFLFWKAMHIRQNHSNKFLFF